MLQIIGHPTSRVLFNIVHCYIKIEITSLSGKVHLCCQTKLPTYLLTRSGVDWLPKLFRSFICYSNAN